MSSDFGQLRQLLLRRERGGDTRASVAGRIRVLDGALIDQIAAGEVVERPASVVKELLENALDAGAGSITVEIEGGGVDLIRITDDGEGMTPDDAPLALVRHATSKLRTFDDLRAVHTLGFRGEALPSIASVSRLTLTTRPRDQLQGTRVRSTGGAAPVAEPIGCAPGTTVEVAELFANVPARRKFLKSRATENAHITQACETVALARPALRLVLLREKRRAREYLPAGSTAERARAVLGSMSLGEIEAELDGVRVQALLGPPEKGRTGAGGLHVFVNGRPVKDRALARAVAFAYGSVLPPGRYPAGVVLVEVDPEQVDVNVHPQKTEVRFARGAAVLDAITRTLAAKLGTTAWSGPSTRGQGYWAQRLGSAGAGAGASGSESASVGGSERVSGSVGGSVGGSGGAGGSGSVASPGASVARGRGGLGALPEGVAGGGGWVGEIRSNHPNALQGVTPHLRDAPSPLLPQTGFFGSLRVLGQARKMLIVCEGGDALYVLDQHAADERVRYHRLRAQYRDEHISTQRLLFPERVECTATEVAFVEESSEALAAVGLEATVVGPTTVAVHAVPTVVKRAAPERLLRDVLDELTRHGDRAFGDAVDTAIATMACHGAIRAGDELSPEECRALLRSVDEVDDFAGHCPHGRPIVFTIPFGELERRLGR